VCRKISSAFFALLLQERPKLQPGEKTENPDAAYA